jgi:hypothetical protein
MEEKPTVTRVLGAALEVGISMQGPAATLGVSLARRRPMVSAGLVGGRCNR